MIEKKFKIMKTAFSTLLPLADRLTAAKVQPCRRDSDENTAARLGEWSSKRAVFKAVGFYCRIDVGLVGMN